MSKGFNMREETLKCGEIVLNVGPLVGIDLATKHVTKAARETGTNIGRIVCSVVMIQTPLDAGKGVDKHLATAA